jgi:cytochrome c-type biogenesis protein CcmH
VNSTFFLIASCLVLIALALILPPLWRKDIVAKSTIPEDQDQRNIIIARQRLAELKEQLQSGALSQAQYDEQFAELELALSDDLDIKSHISAATPPGRWVVYIVALAIPLMAGSLYWTLGNVEAISHSEEMAAANPQAPTPADISKMVSGLAERLKKNPDDAQGWLMLGRSYKYMEQFPKSVEAFANAYRLLGDKPEVMLQYAEAIAFASNKNLTGKPAELINKALAIEPENLNALWLGGMLKAQQKDSQGAVKLWRKLAGLLPPGSDEQIQIQDVLAKMQGTAAEPVEELEPAQASAKSEATIEVSVSLAPELQQSAAPGDTVFIYAQALSGPKMPIAIVRKQVADLPVTVTLNDSMAMMPDRKLSNFDQVKLLARISKSGSAMSQPGDLLGVVEQADSKATKGQTIVINSQVK